MKNQTLKSSQILLHLVSSLPLLLLYVISPSSAQFYNTTSPNDLSSYNRDRSDPSSTTTGRRVPDAPKPYNCTEHCRHGYCQPTDPIIDEVNNIEIPNEKCTCEENWSGRDCNACHGRRLVTSDDGGFVRHGDKTLSHYKDDSVCSWLLQPDYLNHLNSSETIKPIHMTIMEFSSECNWDFLWIYDGDSAQDKKLLTLTGDFPKPNYQLQAKSGTAYIVFTSDSNVNSTGFRIKWQLGKCLYSCSGHGTCDNGVCLCDEDHYGNYCQFTKCPDNCGGQMNLCNTETNVCVCQDKYDKIFKIGDSCSMSAGWQVIGNSTVQIMNLNDNYEPLPESTETMTTVSPEYHQESLAVTGHSMIAFQENHKDYAIITGGIHLDRRYKKDEFEILAYDVNDNRFNVKSWQKVRGRYSHSSVYFGNNMLFVYGGRITVTDEVTNEIWLFVMGTSFIEQVNTKNTKNGYEAPALVDHKSVNCQLRNGTEIILTVFGYSPKFSYVNWIQEFYIDEKTDTKVFRKVKTNGYVPTGAASHTVVYSKELEAVFIYGGYRNNPKPFDSKASPLMLKYLIADRKFIKLEPSVSYFGRYKHSAALVMDKIYIFGGSTITGDQENDAYSNLETMCISDQILVYDIKCDKWDSIMSHETVRRIGHTTATYIVDDSDHGRIYPRIIMFGGFNATIIAALSIFSPGPVNLKTEENRECDNTLDMSNWSCAGEIQCNNCLGAKNNRCGYCAHNGDAESAGSSAPDACQVTFANQPSIPGITDNVIPRGSSSMASPISAGFCPAPIWLKESTECREDGEVRALCSSSETCTNCLASPECSWITIQLGEPTEKSFCTQKPENATVEWPSTQILYPNQFSECSKRDNCAAQNNCHACLNLQCLFCNNRCISKAGFLNEFPYGICPRLKRFSNVLRGADECPFGNIEDINELDQCMAYKSCHDCQKHSYCGWCDFGLNSGLGACYKGGSNGPNTEGICEFKGNNKTWNFISCPECQCNGHSKCINIPETPEQYQYRLKYEFSLDVNLDGQRVDQEGSEIVEKNNKDDVTTGFSFLDGLTSFAGKELESDTDLTSSLTEPLPDKISISQCEKCENLTTGDQCQKCKPGFWGDSRNGGKCKECECFGRAEMCMHNTGECLCNTMWTSGEKCDKCLKPSKDMNFRRYWSNVTPEYTCFIELPINFEYTFTLNRKHEHYIKRLNAIAFPDIDPDSNEQELVITIETSSPVSVQFTLGSTYTDDPNTNDAANLESNNINDNDGTTIVQSTVDNDDSNSTNGSEDSLDKDQKETTDGKDMTKPTEKVKSVESNSENCSKTDNQCEHFLLQTKTEKRLKLDANGNPILPPNSTHILTTNSVSNTNSSETAVDNGANSNFDSNSTNLDSNLNSTEVPDLDFTEMYPTTAVLDDDDYDDGSFISNSTTLDNDGKPEDITTNLTSTDDQTNDVKVGERQGGEGTNSDEITENGNGREVQTQEPEEDDPGKLNYELRYTYRLDDNKKKSSNTSIRIYITDFKTPILLKIRVSKSSDVDLIMFFTVFFTCFLSLLVIAFIAWRIKAAYDDFHRRQQQELELMRMAARPFNNITIRCDQDARNPFNAGNLMTNEKTAGAAGGLATGAALTPNLSLNDGTGSQHQSMAGASSNNCPLPPTAIAKQPLMGDKLAVLTFVVWLPSERTNLTYFQGCCVKNA